MGYSDQKEKELSPTFYKPCAVEYRATGNNKEKRITGSYRVMICTSQQILCG